MDAKMFNVGEIINTHGIHGEVKVYQISDFIDRFEIGKSLYLAQANKPVQEMIVSSYRLHKGFILLKFEGYNNIDDVEGFKGSYLQVTEKQLTKLPDDEYYYHEIIGCTMYTVSGNLIGIVQEIMSPGANDVFIVKNEEDKEILIPNIKLVVKSIDVGNKKIIIDPMEGLLD